MNKRIWNDLYMNRDLEDEDIKKWIKHSYDEVVKETAEVGKDKILRTYDDRHHKPMLAPPEEAV